MSLKNYYLLLYLLFLFRKSTKISDLFLSINSLKIASINPILPLLIFILSPLFKSLICLLKTSFELQFFFIPSKISLDKKHGFSPNFKTLLIPKVLSIFVQFLLHSIFTKMYPGNKGLKILFFLLK